MTRREFAAAARGGLLAGEVLEALQFRGLHAGALVQDPRTRAVLVERAIAQLVELDPVEAVVEQYGRAKPVREQGDQPDRDPRQARAAFARRGDAFDHVGGIADGRHPIVQQALRHQHAQERAGIVG